VTVEFIVGVRVGGSLVGARCVDVGSGVAWAGIAVLPSVSAGLEEGTKLGLDWAVGVLEIGLGLAWIMAVEVPVGLPAVD